MRKTESDLNYFPLHLYTQFCMNINYCYSFNLDNNFVQISHELRDIYEHGVVFFEIQIES